jgi:hypothetical protein
VCGVEWGYSKGVEKVTVTLPHSGYSSHRRPISARSSIATRSANTITACAVSPVSSSRATPLRSEAPSEDGDFTEAVRVSTRHTKSAA